MKHASFDATISALDVETSTFVAATSAMARRSFDATISALDAEMSARRRRRSARSYWRYRCGVYGDIGDCGVSITPQMCNRVTYHGDMSTFSKPVSMHDSQHSETRWPVNDEPLNTFRTLELFSISKKEFVIVLFQFPNTIIRNFLLQTNASSWHDLVLFQHELFIRGIAASGASLCSCALFTYNVLPSKSSNGILFIKQCF